MPLSFLSQSSGLMPAMLNREDARGFLPELLRDFHMYFMAKLGINVQNPAIRLLLGCMIPRPGWRVSSRSLGIAFLWYSVDVCNAKKSQAAENKRINPLHSFCRAPFSHLV